MIENSEDGEEKRKREKEKGKEGESVHEHQMVGLKETSKRNRAVRTKMGAGSAPIAQSLIFLTV